MGMLMEAPLTEAMRRCIGDCTECHDLCLEMVTHCLQMGGRHADPGHIRLLLDCAEICRTSADFMLRGSEFYARQCAVCADVCDRCADSCRSLQDDERMRACAEACERTADSCRDMAV